MQCWQVTLPQVGKHDTDVFVGGIGWIGPISHIGNGEGPCRSWVLGFGTMEVRGWVDSVDVRSSQAPRRSARRG